MAGRTLTVALVGNPNTGKSTLFNALSGLRQRVGNYPGVTVEMKIGEAKIDETTTLRLIDLPGTYSLSPRSQDEMVAVDLLLGRVPGEAKPDVVLSIVDASNLDRHLYLTTQLLELGIPVVIAANMTDTAKAQGIEVDWDGLRKQLQVAIVPIQANRGIGLEDLRSALVRAPQNGVPTPIVEFPPVFEDEVASLRAAFPELPSFLIRRLLLDVGGYTEQRFLSKDSAVGRRLDEARRRLQEANAGVTTLEARLRYGKLRPLLAQNVTRPKVRPVTWTDRLDKVLTHRIWGTSIFLLLMFLVFQAIFNGAAPLMDWIDAGIDGLGQRIDEAMDAGPLRSLIVDGVLAGVGAVVIFLPQIMILFGFLAVLEDCGYMARAAFLMDKLMSRAGLNGKSFIPLLSSMACAIPGIMATRTIENRRDRIATILVAPLMSCSARLPLYMLLIGLFFRDPFWLPGVILFCLYLLGLILAPLMAFVFKRTILRGATPAFLMELPNYKRPQLRMVVRRMIDAGTAFVVRAGSIILAATIVIWALLYFPTQGNGPLPYDQEVNRLEEEITALETAMASPPPGKTTESMEEALHELKQQRNVLDAQWKSNSWLGRLGRAMEPVFRPLGWDWKISVAALASFPAREVVVGVLGIVYNQGEVDAGSIRIQQSEDDPEEEGARGLRAALVAEGPFAGPYRTATALGLLVFFALCAQCVSTLAIIKRETQSWSWPIFTFVYMTVLAYLGALLTYQIGTLVTDQLA